MKSEGEAVTKTMHNCRLIIQVIIMDNSENTSVTSPRPGGVIMKPKGENTKEWCALPMYIIQAVKNNLVPGICIYIYGACSLSTDVYFFNRATFVGQTAVQMPSPAFLSQEKTPSFFRNYSGSALTS